LLVQIIRFLLLLFARDSLTGFLRRFIVLVWGRGVSNSAGMLGLSLSQ